GPNTWPNWRNFSDRIIQPGDIVFMDLAALTWNGYKSCYYRTYCVGKEPTKEQKDTYATALEWLYDSIHAVKAGTTRAKSPRSGRRGSRPGDIRKRTRRRRIYGVMVWGLRNTTRQ